MKNKSNNINKAYTRAVYNSYVKKTHPREPSICEPPLTGRGSLLSILGMA